MIAVQLIWNLCFFIVGLVGGSLWINDLSIDLLGKLSLIVTAVAATSAGTFNLVKMAQQKKQQQWELQKPMLVGLANSLMQQERFQGQYIDFQYKLRQPYNDRTKYEIDWASEQASIAEKRMNSASQESGRLIEELDEIWTSSLPDYLSQSLKHYRESLQKISQDIDDGALNSLDAYEQDHVAVNELLPNVRKACIELSGMLK